MAAYNTFNVFAVDLPTKIRNLNADTLNVSIAKRPATLASPIGVAAE